MAKVPKEILLIKMSLFMQKLPELDHLLLDVQSLAPIYDKVLAGDINSQDQLEVEVSTYMEQFALQILIRNVFELPEDIQHGA